MARDLPIVIQLMIHKVGKSWGRRKNFRPITLGCRPKNFVGFSFLLAVANDRGMDSLSALDRR